MPLELGHDLTLNTSNDEHEEHARYSGAMHSVFIVINGGVLGFLQLKYQSSNIASPFQTHHPTILSFFVFSVIYVLLRVSETKLRVPKLREFVGNVSHFFGAVATLLLLSIIFPVFTLFLLPFMLVWFSALAYISFKELNFSPENPSAEANPDRPPA